TQLADQLARVRIDEQLVRIEAMTLLGLVGPVNAIAVDRARAEPFDVAMPDLVGIFGQLDALELPLAVAVEQAQLDLGRMRREQREIDPFTVPAGTAGMRQAFAQSNRFVHSRRSVSRIRFERSAPLVRSA